VASASKRAWPFALGGVVALSLVPLLWASAVTSGSLRSAACSGTASWVSCHWPKLLAYSGWALLALSSVLFLVAAARLAERANGL
jgi:hypothetical protein